MDLVSEGHCPPLALLHTPLQRTVCKGSKAWLSFLIQDSAGGPSQLQKCLAGQLLLCCSHFHPILLLSLPGRWVYTEPCPRLSGFYKKISISESISWSLDSSCEIHYLE